MKLALLQVTLTLIRLVNETHTITLAQTDTQANQFTRATDHAGNMTDFNKNVQAKVFFFLRLKGDLSLNYCICHMNRYNQEHIAFVKTRHIYLFIKGVIG